MRIERTCYLNRMIESMNNGLIKVITGIRRCGKSYLLFEIFNDYLVSQGVSESNIIKIALDDIEYIELCDPIRLYEYINSMIGDSEEQFYVFIDEAQYAISKDEMKNRDIPMKLYGVLNGLLRKKNVDVYITGSNSKFLSTDILTEFRGRGDEIHIGPLSFSEFYEATGKDIDDAWREYLYYGGLPYVLSEKTDERKVEYLERLHKEIYLKDICERYMVKDENSLETLMKTISSSIGSLTNTQKISDTFNSSGNKMVSMPTISNYLKYLEEAFIVNKVERYDVKGRKYISTPSKYYYTDIGLRNALLNFRQVEETHLMENVIYNTLKSRGYIVDVGVVTVNETINGKSVRKQLEVDFVCNKGNRRYYIQSALSMDTHEKTIQESRSLNGIADNFKKIIISKNTIKPWITDDGILVLGLFDFLLDSSAIDF